MSSNKRLVIKGGAIDYETDVVHGEGGAYSRTYSYEEASGMTLRDHFAGLAMPWALEMATDRVRGVPIGDNRTKDTAVTSTPKAADAAYQMADAMLRARKGEK